MKKYYERSKKEIKDAIKDQLIFIENSCALFDKGHYPEALRIAGSLSILLEKRRRSNGILQVVEYPFKLLSTVPKVQEINLNELTVLKKNNLAELMLDLTTIKNSSKYILTYFLDQKQWHIFSIDKDGNEIFCLLNELADKLELPYELLLLGWINGYTNEDYSLDDIGKRIAIIHLSFLLGHNILYPSGLFFPMIDVSEKDFIAKLSNEYERYLYIDEWLEEIIFCISDSKHVYNSLTRSDLIFSARDKDGGGHFDLALDLPAYCKSKYGEKLATDYNGQDITTKNFHLYMLRVIGYEILNSKSITEYINSSV